MKRSVRGVVAGAPQQAVAPSASDDDRAAEPCFRDCAATCGNTGAAPVPAEAMLQTDKPAAAVGSSAIAAQADAAGEQNSLIPQHQQRRQARPQNPRGRALRMADTAYEVERKGGVVDMGGLVIPTGWDEMPQGCAGQLLCTLGGLRQNCVLCPARFKASPAIGSQTSWSNQAPQQQCEGARNDTGTQIQAPCMVLAVTR